MNRGLLTIATLCVLGCSQAERPVATDAPAARSELSAPPYEVVSVDETALDWQHPLVCGIGGDIPVGHEIAFRNSSSGEFIHAVFPEGVAHPEDPNGSFTLHGRRQAIQNRERYTMKRPPDDYRYFVVSSWTREP